MSDWLALALLVANGVAALVWLGVLVEPARAWRLQPVAEDEAPPPEPGVWPRVRVIIPAHNEETVLADALGTVLGQDYPGDWGVVLVDERSDDGTGALARRTAREHRAGRRLEVVAGSTLPGEWAGKVWGLEQGFRVARPAGPVYYLLTDADIAHDPGSLRRLVAESEAAGHVLNSRMARLHCATWAEKLMLPAFVFFFNLLYPMRRVNDPSDRMAAAAGGCVLLRASALDALGGFGSIRGEVIDDVNLARAVSTVSPRLRLAISRSEVRSLRRYASLGPIWRMVRRTAFDELGYSWTRLAATVIGMVVLFPLPIASLGLASGIGGATAAGAVDVSAWKPAAVGALALGAMLAMHRAYRPATALFDLRPVWTWTLGLAGLLYGLVTLDSARRHALGRSRSW